MAKMIKKENIAKLLDSLIESNDVHAPTGTGNVTVFKNIGKGEEARLDYINSEKPPKSVFFPQTEKFFDYEIEGSHITGIAEKTLPDKPMILFGMRPCDARAMTQLDKVFHKDYPDPYWENRRARTTVVTLVCVPPTMPQANCFCTSIGGNPHDKTGSDLLLVEVGDAYLAEPVTEKGEALVKQAGSLFGEASDAQVKKAGELAKEAEGKIAKAIETDGILERLEGMFDSDYWFDFSQRCLGCGICTLLCPTCHCFDIDDVKNRGKAWRERTWDSCQYAFYTVHASGHNPRPEKKFRQRNRVYHKFLYMHHNLDLIGCVGCGRCINKCPVNIDIVEVVNGIKVAVR